MPGVKDETLDDLEQRLSSAMDEIAPLQRNPNSRDEPSIGTPPTDPRVRNPNDEELAWAKSEITKPKRTPPAKRVARAEKIAATLADTSGGNGEHTGGSVDYYKLRIEHPTHHNVPYEVECNDIIKALEMDFAEGNVFKALWRTAAARQGKLKRGHDAKYDAEKIVFFGQRLLARAVRYLGGKQ
jgi:hypothetical protein